MTKIAGLTDQRQILEGIRDRLAGVLDGDVGHRASCDCRCGVPPDMRTIPTTAKELREVVSDLAEMPVATGVSELDDIQAARAARQEKARAAAAEHDPAPPARKQRRTGSDQAGGDRRAGA
jgi:hypothetical protein